MSVLKLVRENKHTTHMTSSMHNAPFKNVANNITVTLEQPKSVK